MTLPGGGGGCAGVMTASFPEVAPTLLFPATFDILRGDDKMRFRIKARRRHRRMHLVTCVRFHVTSQLGVYFALSCTTTTFYFRD